MTRIKMTASYTVIVADDMAELQAKANEHLSECELHAFFTEPIGPPMLMPDGSISQAFNDHQWIDLEEWEQSEVESNGQSD